MTLVVDPLRSASHANFAAHLSGPFAGGARVTKLVIDNAGVAHVDWEARLPLLLVAPIEDVGATALDCVVTITQTSAEVVAPRTVRFAPYSESGASVLAYRPGPVSMSLDRATRFDVKLGPIGVEVPAASLFDLYVVEGNLGRLLYTMGAEKMRLRRQAFELYAMRRLAAAKRDALDRFGRDLGVPRFDTKLVWDATLAMPTIAPHREEDAAYRARLAIYRGFSRPSRHAVELAVNGPGASTDPNRGLPSSVGVTPRVQIDEPDTDLVIAMRLLAAPNNTERVQYLGYLRDAFLLQPGAPVPDARLIPSTIKAAENALRTQLATTFDWPANAMIAPELARALDRVGACRAALGVSRKWRVLRAQDDAGGSRYELGLGIDLETPPSGELTTLVNAVTNHAIAANASAEVRALVAGMTPMPEAQDPQGRWILNACGLPTVHTLDDTKTYVSHLVTHGLVIGTSVVDTRTMLEARWNAPRDSGPDIVLVLALSDAEKARVTLGIPAWTLLTGATERTAWAAAAAPPAPLIAAMGEAALHMVDTAAHVTAAAHALEAIPSELVITLQLDTAFAAQLIAHDPAATELLRKLVVAVQDAGVTSLLPLFTTDGRVLLIASTLALPGDATLLTLRFKSALRWFLVPISGEPGTLASKVGSRNEWLSTAPGLAAVVAIAPGRRGGPDPRNRVDPLSIRVSLPDAARLDLEQYEFLMNLLERSHPLGVIVDTRGIRTHIDADGDGDAEALSQLLSRTFRTFRQPRRIGSDEA